jgi:hypothetical protein
MSNIIHSIHNSIHNSIHIPSNIRSNIIHSTTCRNNSTTTTNNRLRHRTCDIRDSACDRLLSQIIATSSHHHILIRPRTIHPTQARITPPRRLCTAANS